MSTLLKDGTVTDMLWDSKSARLFFGDDQGRVALSYMPKVRLWTSLATPLVSEAVAD